jgi:ribose transport system substrate-binding protein
MRRIVSLALVSCLCAALAGCSSGGVVSRSPGEQASASEKKGIIGVSVLTLTNPFFKEIADKITDEAAKQGYDTIIVSGDMNVAKQQTQMRDFRVRGCAAIVICPCDSKGIGPAIQECNSAGIPVFTADIASLAPGAKVVTHVATDNYGGGKQAGEAMIEALGKAGGKVVIIDYKQAESCILRVKGFKEVLDARNQEHPQAVITIVAELPGEGAKDRGFKAAEDALQAHPDLAGIFAINDPSALGARAAVEKAEKTRQVKIIGFDGQLDGKQAIKEGRIYADPIQFPDRIGEITVDCIVRYFAGEKLPPEELIPTALYRQADGEKDPALR